MIIKSSKHFFPDFKLAVVASFILFLGCATYYDYKYVKNVNTKKRGKAFRYDMKTCQARAKSQARSPDAFIIPDSGIDNRPGLFKRCMIRRGWRLKK